MSLGRRPSARQQDIWVSASELPKSTGHIFYVKLNELLSTAEFDIYVEKLCQEYYHDKIGRPGIPPGVYFRMLLVGYFEGIGSQRGIAWRCADSLSLRSFLGIPLSEKTPEHSSLTRIRDRLPLEAHAAVFQFVLQQAQSAGLLKGKTVAVDATTLEANAAMKSIVRRDTGADWNEYLKRLMQEEGLIGEDDDPTDEELRRYDKGRKKKKVSNEQWVSSTDPDSRITKMKDGRTHLAYKAEHVVDLETEVVLAAEVYTANTGDTDTLVDSVMEAEVHLTNAGLEANIKEVVADKGYHAAHTLELATDLNLRTYIPEPQRHKKLRWTDKPPEYKEAVYANRRRGKTEKSRRLQRQRSERVERSFAHVCETGGARRTWLRSLDKVRKRYLVSAFARNLGLLMRHLFGFGTARSLQREDEGVCSSCLNQIAVAVLVGFHRTLWTRVFRQPLIDATISATRCQKPLARHLGQIVPCSTGC
jgi:transposase